MSTIKVPKQFKNRVEQLTIHRYAVDISHLIQDTDSKGIEQCKTEISTLLSSLDERSLKLVVDYQHNWVLSIACFHGHDFAINELIKHGANPDDISSTTSSNYSNTEQVKFADNLKKSKILKEQLFLEQHIPEAKASVSKGLKF